MRINVLGPIEVTEAGKELRLSGQRQRAVFAALVLDAGKVVPLRRLADIVWDMNPPPTARTKIQTHISTLRRAFGEVGRDGAMVLQTARAGYRLRVADLSCDLSEFTDWADRGRTALAAGDAHQALGYLRAALRLWRGQPFADVSSSLVRSAADGIGLLRLQAVEARAQAHLALGDLDIVAGQGREWLVRDPLQEGLRALVMVALYRLGCRADALLLYREGREISMAELGIEPGPELRGLYQHILACDPVV